MPFPSPARRRAAPAPPRGRGFTLYVVHLNGCLDVDTGRSRATDVEEVADPIEWARSRDERIIDRGVSRLRESGELDIGETNVVHSVRVICEDCGRSHRVRELLDGRRRECGGTTGTA